MGCKKHLKVITHADGSRGVRVYTSVCLSVSVYLHDISRTSAARITKLDTEIFHSKSWKPIYFGIKRSKIAVMKHKKTAGVRFCTFVSAGFFYYNMVYHM